MDAKTEQFEIGAGLLIQKPVPTLGFFLVALPILVFLTWCLLSNLGSSLRQYPGPWLARKSSALIYQDEVKGDILIELTWTGYTNLWRLLLVRRGDYHIQIKKLHEIYGPILRIGPNTLDLDIPELAKVLYSTDGKWRKVLDLQSRACVDIANKELG